MLLHQSQKQVVTDTHRFKVINAGRGWGKSLLAIELLLWHAVNKKDAKVLYVAPTFGASRDIIWDRLIQRVADIALKTNQTLLEVEVPTVHGGNSLIMLRGWESVQTLRGQEFDFIVLDEVAQMRGFQIGWEQVLRPTLRMSQGPVVFISTPLGFNFWYDLYNTNDPDYRAFHFTSYDNPFLPTEEIEAAKRSLPVDSFAQEYLADFRKQTGLVFKEFDRARHVTTNKPHTVVQKIAGVDFGFTNPTAILTILKDNDSKYYVTEEFYRKEQTQDAINDYIAAKQYAAVYPDPAEPDRIDTMRRRGIPVRDVIKDVELKINTVRELLVQNRLFIDPSCINLIWEMETYAYKEKKEKNNLPEEPIKENDHAVDAMCYALSMQASQATTAPRIVYNQIPKYGNPHAK